MHTNPLHLLCTTSNEPANCNHPCPQRICSATPLIILPANADHLATTPCIAIRGTIEAPDCWLTGHLPPVHHHTWRVDMSAVAFAVYRGRKAHRHLQHPLQTPRMPVRQNYATMELRRRIKSSNGGSVKKQSKFMLMICYCYESDV